MKVMQWLLFWLDVCLNFKNADEEVKAKLHLA
jgi:hypothetical protein